MWLILGRSNSRGVTSRGGDVIKLRSVRTWHVACMGEISHAYRILVI